MNYRNILNKGTSILRKNSILTPGLDAELLLSLSINRSRERILLNLEKEINSYEEKKYFKLINRRKQKEPISFISGKKFFSTR